jgi:hypothetical protein
MFLWISRSRFVVQYVWYNYYFLFFLFFVIWFCFVDFVFNFQFSFDVRLNLKFDFCFRNNEIRSKKELNESLSPNGDRRPRRVGWDTWQQVCKQITTNSLQIISTSSNNINCSLRNSFVRLRFVFYFLTSSYIQDVSKLNISLYI